MPRYKLIVILCREDVVIWDSHPLALGATPVQVFIDGVPQLTSPTVVEKPAASQVAPKTPDFEQDRQDAIKYEGLPPLTPLRSRADTVLFTNVSNVWTRDAEGAVVESFSAKKALPGVAVVQSGKLICHGGAANCASFTATIDSTIDLQGGSLQPGLVTVGSSLGLQEIQGESSTVDGVVFNPLEGDVPSILGYPLPRAADGLIFGTRDSL